MPRNNYTRRNSLRYPGYDYTSCGAYYITICTYWGRCLFGQIRDQEMILNDVGRIAEECWLAIPDHHPHIELDEHVIMPNHTHGTLCIVERVDLESNEHSLSKRSQADKARSGFNTARYDPVIREFGKPIAGSISTVIGSYKAAVSREVNKLGIMPEPMDWHRNFWDRIVRNDLELERYRSYMRANSVRWLEDKLHPDMPLNKFNAEWRESAEYQKQHRKGKS